MAREMKTAGAQGYSHESTDLPLHAQIASWHAFEDKVRERDPEALEDLKRLQRPDARIHSDTMRNVSRTRHAAALYDETTRVIAELRGNGGPEEEKYLAAALLLREYAEQQLNGKQDRRKRTKQN